MSADPRKALAPLSPRDVEKLGPPESWTYQRDGDRDISIHGWTLGEGTIEAPGTGELRRGTIVTVSLTTTGRLITSRIPCEGTRADKWQAESATAQFHETPQAAYQWLVNDSKGRLGAASKAAWVKACRAFRPMAEFAVERID